MKKILVVLTILALAAGFAFAAISGSVTASYKFAFGTNADGSVKEWGANAGYSKPGKGAIDATFTLDSQSAGFTGENMPYVNLEVTAKITGYYGYSEKHADSKTAGQLSFAFAVAKFDIVGDGWKLNLLKSSGAALDLAVSAIDSEEFYNDTPEYNVAYYTYANEFDYADGVTFTYNDFVIGAGFNTVDLKDKNAAISLEVATPELAFGDVKVQAGAGFSQTGWTKGTDEKVEQVCFMTDKEAQAIKSNDNVTWTAEGAGAVIDTGVRNGLPKNAGFYTKKTDAVPAKDGGSKLIGFSAKVAYDADVKASVAIDLGSRAGDISFDLAANLQVAPVTVDVYYNNKGAEATNAKKATETIDNLADNYLSARAKVALADVVENVPVTLTVTGKNLLNDARTFDVEAKTTAIKDFDITAGVYKIDAYKNISVGAEVVYTGIENLELDATAEYLIAAKVIDLGLDAEYEAEMFKATVGASIKTNFTVSLFGFSASVESDKLVEGATLKAAFGGLTLGEKVVATDKITAAALTMSCTVKF